MNTPTMKGLASFFDACDQGHKDRKLARAFETALAVVFTKARQQHGLDARFVRYRQCLYDDGHFAEFNDGTDLYVVAFGTDLQLEDITRVCDGKRVWRRSPPEFARGNS